MSKDILTPVGRLVQGGPFERNTTDAEGRPLVIKNGPNAGQPRVEYFMAIAVPKTDPGWPALWALIRAEAAESFTHLAPTIQPMVDPSSAPQLQFAFKVTDGDSQIPNKKGSRPCDKEGFPGHWVLSFSGGFAPKCLTANGAASISDPDAFKRGYYIRIFGSVRGNGATQQPGVYLNHAMVELVAYGEEIVTGPDGAQVFGSQPAGVLPAGASQTPLAPKTAASPGPDTAPIAAAPPASNVQPAPDFLNGPTPVEEVKYLDAKNNAWTEAQLTAAGYSALQIQALPRA